MVKKITLCVCGVSNWRWVSGQGWTCQSCGEVDKVMGKDPRPQFWVRPAHMDKNIMFCFQADNPDDAAAWDIAMRRLLKPYNGFQQIAQPVPPCVTFKPCRQHYFCCPGWYAWELWSIGGEDETSLFALFLAIAAEAAEIREEFQ